MTLIQERQKILRMKSENLLNKDFDLFLKSYGFKEEKVNILVDYFQKNYLDQLLDLLFEENIHFIKIKWDDWHKEPVFPLLYSNTNGDIKFFKSANSTFTIPKSGHFFCLASEKLMPSVRRGDWLKVAIALINLSKLPFIFLILLLVFEKFATFAIAYQFQELLRIFDGKNSSVAFSLVIGWGFLRLILMASGALAEYMSFVTLAHLKRSNLPEVLIGLFKNKNLNKSADSVGKSFLAIESLSEVIQMAVIFILKLPVQLIALISFMVYLAYYDLRLPLLTLFFFALSALTKNISGKRLSKLRENDLEKSSRFTSTMSSFVMNYGVILSHGVQKWALRLWNKDLSDSIEVKNRLIFFSHLFDLINNLIVHSIFFLTFYLVSIEWKITNNDFAFAGTLSLIVSYTFASLEEVTDIILKSWDLKALLKTIPQNILKDPIHIGSSSNESMLIEFKSASFMYEKILVLRNVDFSLNKKSLVAFIGENGTGKSTLIQALSGFLSSTSGNTRSNILTGEVISITKFDRLFPGTLADNLYISDSLNLEVLEEIMHFVCMDEWLAEQPLGLKTIIGEKGVGLSGGENFRLLLARALILRPKVLVLDEATASLDLETEYKILRNLKKFEFGLEAIIIVSHRKENLKLADKIYKFENQTVAVNENL